MLTDTGCHYSSFDVIYSAMLCMTHLGNVRLHSFICRWFEQLTEKQYQINQYLALILLPCLVIYLQKALNLNWTWKSNL